MEVQQFISIAPWTVIFQILNLLLLMVLFKKYLFKPVTEILKKRQAEIEGHYQEAQQAETDAKAMKADYESKMAGARQEADRVIKTATESANAMSASIVEDARTQADQLKRRAQIKSEIQPRKNGTYTVTLAFNDDDDQPLLKMDLMVPKEVMAKDLAERFQKNPEQLYTGVLNTLFSEPDEGK